jgi:hypothetical protein
LIFFGPKCGNRRRAAMTRSATQSDVACGQLAAAWLSSSNQRGFPLSRRRFHNTFGIGFCILFAFIGTFTHVNFVLARVQSFDTQSMIWGGLAVAGAGLPLLVPHLILVLIGVVLVGVGTFLAQAKATGFVGRAATTDPGSASGIYLASYFSGGVVVFAVLNLAGALLVYISLNRMTHPATKRSPRSSPFEVWAVQA